MSTKSVLLIEDEVLLCWVVEDSLVSAGYEVTLAQTGSEGLAAIEGPKHFDAIITNIRLTDGPDGWALARRARELRPDIPIVYVTGDSAALHELEGVVDTRVLAKPFKDRALETTLEEMLAGR